MKLLFLNRFGIGLCFLMLYACVTNPVTNKKQFGVMSEEREKQLGASYDPSVVQSFGLYNDPTIQKFIDEKGQEMVKVSHRPNLPFEFKILDSPVVNAFAVPGGYVYFTRGIMAHFNNEAEFAGVLGHEIGHVTARHSAIQQRNQIATQIGQIAFAVLAPETYAQFAEQSSQAVQLLLLANSRGAESQSDELGVSYSTKVGYDAKEMANFFQTISRLSGDPSQRLPTFLSTHPDPDDRYNVVRQNAEKTQQSVPNKAGFKVNRESYLRMIDGLVYGNDPKQGFVENDKFYHPVLKIEFPTPRDWSVNNTPSQVQFAPANGEAFMVLSLSQGSNLQETEAQMVEQYQLVVKNSRNATINQFPSRIISSTHTDTQSGQSMELLTYLLRDGDLIYVFHGITTTNKISIYRSLFERTMNNFKRLTDQRIIDKKPERIRIKTVPRTATLESILRTYGIEGDRVEELSILNGMQRTDQVTKGMLIKTVGE